MSSLSVFHPQEIKSLTSLSFTKSCCQEENHSSAATYGKKKSEDVTRKTDIAKKEENMIALSPRQMEEAKSSRTFSPQKIHSLGCIVEETTREGYQKVGFEKAHSFSQWLTGPCFSVPDQCRMAGGGRRHVAAGSPG